MEGKKIMSWCFNLEALKSRIVYFRFHRVALLLEGHFSFKMQLDVFQLKHHKCRPIIKILGVCKHVRRL